MHISWTNFTAYKKAAANREAVCEMCDCRYGYELTRTVAGHGSTIYHIAEEAAVDRAARDAEKHLERSLKLAVDPVRCPVCGWLQKDMIREWRRRQCSTLRAVAICILYFASLVGFCWVAIAWSAGSLGEFKFDLMIWCGIPIALALVLLLIRHVIVQANNPNAGYPRLQIDSLPAQ